MFDKGLDIIQFPLMSGQDAWRLILLGSDTVIPYCTCTYTYISMEDLPADEKDKAAGFRAQTV